MSPPRRRASRGDVCPGRSARGPAWSCKKRIYAWTFTDPGEFEWTVTHAGVSSIPTVLGRGTYEVEGDDRLILDLGVFNQDPATAIGIMGEWYNGYRFAEEAETDLYNTDMVLYYLKHSIPNRDVPEYLIDSNVRIDYGKLRHLLVTGRQLNGNFDLLRDVIGEEKVDTRIQPGFPLKDLTKQENFYSLLHYFGLLSIRDVQGVMPRLAIPNQTVKRLMYGYLRDACRDVGVFSVNLFRLEQLMMGMANRGEWRPVLEFLSEAIARQTGIRDYIGGEKVLAPRPGPLGFLAAYLSVTDYYVFRSEAELGKGHADIALGAAGRPLSAPAARLPDRAQVSLKRSRARRDQAAVDAGVAAAEATGAAPSGTLRTSGWQRQFPGCALHRPDRGVPRLGAGVLRRGAAVTARPLARPHPIRLPSFPAVVP